MTLGRIIFNNARQRPLSTLLTSLSVSVGVALIIVILSIRQTAWQRFSLGYSGFDLVVGAKGSPLQLVLNAMFNLDASPGNIPWSLYEKLAKDPRVKLATPFAVGDSYEGFRIVATTDAYLSQFEPRLNQPYELENGRIFRFSEKAVKEAMREAAERGKLGESGKKNHDHNEEHHHAEQEACEAVIGATVAQETGLKVGSTFVATHGVRESDDAAKHEHSPWTVVGALKPTGTPADRTIYINLDSFYHIEGHVIEESKPLEGGEQNPKTKDKVALTVGQISALGLKLKAPFARFALRKQINETEVAQAAFPTEEIRKLMSIVGNVDRILLAQAVLIVFVAAIGTSLALFNSMNDRRRDIAVMRALGARRKTIFAIVVGEAMLISMMGMAMGLGLGHGTVALASPFVEAAAPGFSLDAWTFQVFEIFVFAGVLIVGILAGLGPGVLAYRANVARGLTPT